MHAVQSKTKKWFLRCRGCLSVMAMETDRPAATMRCAACEGSIEVMGQVHPKKLLKLEERCLCDNRCTMAAGPECNCQCAGANHGSGVLVAAALVVGGIPRITPPDPSKANRIHSEWLGAMRAVKARIVKHCPQLVNPDEKYVAHGFGAAQAIRGARYMDEVARAAAMKTHHGRMQALKKLDEKITAGAR